MVGITYVYIDKIFVFYGCILSTNFFSYPSLLPSMMFEYDYMLFWVSYMYVFCILVIALFQRN